MSTDVSSPRQFGVDGYPLSSARNVTLNVHPAENVRGIFTLMLPAWGQFVDHDIVSVLSKGKFYIIQFWSFLLVVLMLELICVNQVDTFYIIDL